MSDALTVGRQRHPNIDVTRPIDRAPPRLRDLSSQEAPAPRLMAQSAKKCAAPCEPPRLAAIA